MGSGGPRPTRGSGGDAVDLLVRREPFLDRLAEAPAEKPALVNDLDVSRSTVDRAIRELRVEGLVERQDDGFALTHYGGVSFRCFRQFVRGVDTVRRSRESLQHLPPSVDLPPAFFRDGTILSARGGDERKPAAFLRDLLANADELWTVTESPHFELISLAQQRVIEEEMRFNLIHSLDTVERLRIHYPDVLESTLRSGYLDLYASEEVPPFGLIKATAEQETVVLVLYGQKGETETVVITETCAAATRFDEFFREQRSDASRIELDADGNPTMT